MRARVGHEHEWVGEHEHEGAQTREARECYNIGGPPTFFLQHTSLSIALACLDGTGMILHMIMPPSLHEFMNTLTDQDLLL